MICRRLFLEGGALVALGLSAPKVLVRVAAAADTGGKTLVVLGLRGGFDGLGAVIPYRDPTFFAARPSSADAVLDLDGYFGFHPALAPLLPLWKDRRLALVHAVGPPRVNRVHTQAQAFLDAGTTDAEKAREGWLNRLLARGAERQGGRADPPPGPPLPGDSGALASSGSVDRRGAGVAARPSAMLEGALAIPTAAPAGSGIDDVSRAALDAMYADATDATFTPAVKDAVRAVHAIEAARDAQKPPANGAVYPDAAPGAGLRLVAQLIRAEPGLRIAYTEMEGWDHHAKAGERMPVRLDTLARALAAFAQDLGDRLRDVMLVTVTEFGRAVAENATGGTDHGYGSCAFVLGGPVKGGQVHGVWPGLGAEDRFEGRDLLATTDWRDVIAEVLRGHLGVSTPELVFPGFSERPERLGIVRTG